MLDRETLTNLRQLIELDRALGIDFVFNLATSTAPPSAVSAPAVTIKPVPATKPPETSAPLPLAPSP